MAITTEQIKELRDETGVSVMQCKRALEEAGGDKEKALMILKKKSSEVALKKSDRQASDGVIVSKVTNGKGIMLTLHCETDFVAKNSDFTTLANSLADKALTDGVEKMKGEAMDMINPVIQKIGENIQLGEISEVSGDVIGSYIHDGKSGTMIALTGGNADVAKDIAMHTTAMRPEYITREEIAPEMIEKAKELFKEEVDASGKPEDIKQKMLDGKLATYFKEQTLLDQPFVKNPDITIEGLLKQNSATISKVVRMSIR